MILLCSKMHWSKRATAAKLASYLSKMRCPPIVRAVAPVIPVCLAGLCAERQWAHDWSKWAPEPAPEWECVNSEPRLTYDTALRILQQHHGGTCVGSTLCNLGCGTGAAPAHFLQEAAMSKCCCYGYLLGNRSKHACALLITWQAFDRGLVRHTCWVLPGVGHLLLIRSLGIAFQARDGVLPLFSFTWSVRSVAIATAGMPVH